ncbi:MAG: metallophosphoesterase, partial [bacterium]
MADYIAIGDIHGMDGMLEKLLGCLPEAGTLVFLGDYIDRGPGSRRVLDRLLALEQQRKCIFLRGNHEMLALDALKGDRQAELMWLFNGGAETVSEYEGGVLTPEHIDFLKRTQFYHSTNETIFV